MEEFKTFLYQFLIEHGYNDTANNLGILIFILTLIFSSLIPAIWKFSKFLNSHFQQIRAIKDLHPFFFPGEIKSATRFYINTKCQNIPPSDYDELRSNHAFAVQENLMPFFLNKVLKYNSKSENRFYFILSDSGMGKTTFLINLYIKYNNRIKRKFNIKLFPLGLKLVDEEIKNINKEERRKTILLLDAFDEDINASINYKKRLQDIVDLVWDFRIVIFTSRTQFFENVSEEPNDTGILKFGVEKGSLTFQKIYISPFNDSDIKKYLRKKFSILRFSKRIRGFNIVKNCPNLMVRPMLLAYIEDLLSLRYELKNSSQSYSALIKKWIERESMRIEPLRKQAFKNELYKFSDEVAVNILKKRNERGGLFISAIEMRNLAKINGINLDEIEMKSRSLLNRHSDGSFKFAHRSILEYFIANRLLINKSSLGSIDLKSFDQAYNFYIEMFWDKIKSEKPKETIDLSHKLLHEIKNMVEFNHLKYIELNNNYISNLNPLKNCKSIIGLQLNNNLISDIKPLKELKTLQYLYLRGNEISDISSIYDLKNLIEIELTNNPIDKNQILQFQKQLPDTKIIFR